MLIDEVTITVQAGKGGDGAVSFRKNEGNPRGGPDGGNGGNGGNVYIVGVDDMMALRQFQFKKFLKADPGVNGSRKNLFGRKGEDLLLKVPLGTQITDTQTGESFEILERDIPFLVAEGGIGGRGNNEFKSATMQAPRHAEVGTPGEKRTLHLTLRIIADIGFIGLPNAGKSSLLAVLTNANPKVGNYPFTTLEPNLGALPARNATSTGMPLAKPMAARQSVAGGDGIILADIPGLIEGAHLGRGLGIKFLKHIEKTKLLVHCIDITTDDILKVYHLVREEFASYKKELLEKPEIILLTKTDLVSEDEVKEKVKQMKKVSSDIYTVSVYDGESLKKFEEVLKTKINTLSSQIESGIQKGVDPESSQPACLRRADGGQGSG